MKTTVETPLGELMVVTDRKDWNGLVKLLVEVAKELHLPLPKALYYGPADYWRILSPEDFQDRHLTGRGVSGRAEYWHRDQMILFFGSLDGASVSEVKGFLAHELMHHLDNLQQRSLTSYALFCAPFCDVGYPSACVDIIKACVDTLRSVSINSRLPADYGKVCLLENLREAKRAFQEDMSSKEEAGRRLAMIFFVIVTMGLGLFGEVEREVARMRDEAIQACPSLSHVSIFLAEHFEKAFGEQLDQDREGRFLSDLRPNVCGLMRDVFG